MDLEIPGAGEEGSGDNGSGNSCGVNYYDTYGVKFDEARGLSKLAAKDKANQWNAEHQSTCTSQCGAEDKWCRESC